MRFRLLFFTAMLIACFPLLIVPEVLSAPGSKALALRERLLNSLGGSEKAGATLSILASGTVEDLVRGRPGEVSIYMLPDGRFRMDLVLGSDSISKVRRGPASYVSRGGARLVSADGAEAWLVDFERKCLGLVFHLLEEGAEPDYSGMGISGGKRYEKLTVYDPGGPAIVLVIDGKSGRVEVASMDSGLGPGGRFRMEFSDYRSEGQLVLPHAFREFVAGKPVLDLSIKSYTLDTTVAPMLFEP